MLRSRSTAAVRSSGRGTILYSLLLGSVLFLLQLWYWQTHIKAAYYPFGDDFSLIVHSTRVFGAHPSEWFTRGFADYFRPYPDLAIAYSEFLRPVDNSVYYLESIVFGSQWADYLLANYVIAAAVAAMTLVIGFHLLRLPLALVTLSTCAAIASPAYTYHVLFRPSFAFDYLGTLWVLLCLFFLVRENLAAAWIFCFLGVLTKETAYYSAVAACVSLLVSNGGWRTPKRRWQAALFLLPLMFIFLLRRLDFDKVTGVYVLAGASKTALIRNMVLGFTRWPYLLRGEQHIFERSAHNLASLLLSAVLWILLAVTLRSMLREQRRPGTPVAAHPSAARFTVLIFLLGSLCFPMALGLVERFGASTYPLLFLTLAALAASLDVQQWARWAAVATLLLITFENGLGLLSTFSSKTLRLQRAQWSLGRSLVDYLATDRHPFVFLLGDRVEAFASPAAVQRFSGYPGQVIPISNVLAGTCASPGTMSFLKISGGYASETSFQPGCGTSVLFTASRPSGDTGETLQRDLPQAQIAYQSPARCETPGTYDWQTLRVVLSPRVSSYAVISPELTSSAYQVIASSE